MYVRLLQRCFFSVCWLSRNTGAGSHSKDLFKFLKNCQATLHSGCPKKWLFIKAWKVLPSLRENPGQLESQQHFMAWPGSHPGQSQPGTEAHEHARFSKKNPHTAPVLEVDAAERGRGTDSVRGGHLRSALRTKARTPVDGKPPAAAGCLAFGVDLVCSTKWVSRSTQLFKFSF